LDWFIKLANITDLNTIFDDLYPGSISLRDYLWVNDTYTLELTKKSLEIIPPELVVTMLKWAVQDFWHRRSGWPDLLMFKDKYFQFVEVKSPHDRLSLDQMQWFRWVSEFGKIPHEICRIKKNLVQNECARA